MIPEIDFRFISRITDNSEVSYQYDLDDVVKSIRSQSKMCEMAPVFYSALRREIKTNKKDIY